MSRHRLYQNYDYEDELSDYDGQGAQDEEEDELSPEDRKQMTEATAEVLSALGLQSDKITVQQIQEALWHYYYDVDKSVAYLINKYIDPPKKEAKPKAKPATPASDAGKKTAKPSKHVTDTASELNKLKIADAAPLPKSKNLDVLREYNGSERKKELSFVVVGHVDSGKSTMLGRLLLDMNVVDQRTIDKYQKEAEKSGKSSFALAWVLDSKTEERARGVTMDIGTNHFETDATMLTLIDAPGHRDFIPNMLAGVGLADFAVLVVDAAKGAFEAGLKGQTREHALLLRSMGVFRIIVAVNKLDTTEWDTERFTEIQDQILGSLKALKFPLKDISFVPVSGLQGDNIVRRSTHKAASWYTGPTLLEELEKSEPITKTEDHSKPLRVMITDLWDTPQSAVTISGRIEAGSVQIGDAVLVQPSGEKAYIKAIERSGQPDPVDWAVAGQQVVLYLSHIDEINVHIGDVICSVSDPVACVNMFTMRALAFDTFFPMPVDLHRGRLAAPAFIRELTATLDIQKGTIIKKKPQIIKAGTVGRVRVRIEEGAKLPLEKGQRVILRSEGSTVAAGLIE
ncbi:elongation factor Tu GTP binding domain-containing protein [Coniella lustricola]|uniref:Elongation factor 1 alpha-like protein n=1 Tax=Coniella lustricola TaxID=2025994 RepID=A0A2T2ZY60_9PEZI|nr:elongation factor Tu GTP binding domain-containing protein [Coniella lustricola]